MKIEKITENKIRIILNMEDLKNNNLDLQALITNSAESHQMLLNLLDKAEEEIGFITKDCKIMIEAIASTDGQFIFTITRFAPESDKTYLQNLPKKNLSVKRKSIKIETKNVIYSFDSFEDFCSFATYTSKTNLADLKNFSKDFSLYLYKDIYYLVISKINTNFKYLHEFYSSISEFGKLVTYSQIFEAKLFEYGKCIIKKNAIKKCIEHFA